MLIALITGITGQDGSYMAELLLSKGYRVVGAVRNIKNSTELLIPELANNIELVSWANDPGSPVGLTLYFESRH